MVLNGHHTPKPSPPSPSTPPPPPLISPKDGSSLFDRARANSALHVLPGGLSSASDGAAPACGFYRRDDARTPEQGDAIAACSYLCWRYVGRADVLVALEEGAHEVALALEEGAPATAQA